MIKNLKKIERPILKKKEPIRVVYSINNCLQQICNEYVNSSKKITGNINYKKLINSKVYEDIKENLFYLQKFDIFSLKGNNLRKSFFINLFNIMFIHTLIQFGIPNNKISRIYFFNNSNYTFRYFFIF
jgi:hypothetical protein